MAPDGHVITALDVLKEWAERGDVAVVMPDLRDADGSATVYVHPMMPYMAALVSMNSEVRTRAIVGFARCAHHLTRQQLAEQRAKRRQEA